MRGAMDIRKEHKAIVAKLAELEEEGDKAGCDGPLPKKRQLYSSLHAIQMTLEWVHPYLVKAPTGVSHHQMLMGHRFFIYGPLVATLYP
ncbi:MAG: hypothetical protein WB983_00700 [Terriglobales bacterium]